MLTGDTKFPPSSSNGKCSTVTPISRHTVTDTLQHIGKTFQWHIADCADWERQWVETGWADSLGGWAKELQSQQSLLLISCTAYSYERRADGMGSPLVALPNSFKKDKRKPWQGAKGWRYQLDHLCGTMCLCGKLSQKKYSQILYMSFFEQAIPPLRQVKRERRSLCFRCSSLQRFRLLERASSCSSPSLCFSSRSFCRISSEALVWTKRW